MKKWLLLGCAVPALAFSANVASAQDFKVTISGEAKFQAMFGSQDRNANSRSVDFRNRFRLNVNPEATAMNGALTYGAGLRMRAEGGQNSVTDFDRAYVYASGKFGTVLGGTHTTYNDDVGAVTAPNDWRTESSVALDFVNASKDSKYGSAATGLAAWRWDTLDPTGVNSTLRYQSPFVSGVQFGVAYTPSSAKDGSNTTAWSFNRSKNGLTDVYEVGLKFDSTDATIADKFGGAVLKASADYMGGKMKSASGTALKNLSAFQGGVQVGYAGFTVGGGVVYYGKSGLSKSLDNLEAAYTYRAAAQYKTGPWTLGIGYDYSQKDVNFDVTDAGSYYTGGAKAKKKAEQYGIGLDYAVAKGLNVEAEYDYVKTKNSLTNDSDKASVVILSTVVSF